MASPVGRLSKFIVGLSIPLMACGAVHDQSSSPPQALSAAVCAQQSEVFLAVSEFDPRMVVTHQYGQKQLTLLGIGDETDGLQFLWTQVVNEQVTDEPADTIGPLKPDPLVAQSPNRVLAVTETVQTLADVANASKFFAMFGKGSRAQVNVSGKLVTVSSGAPIKMGLGDESMAQETSAPTSNIPTELQFVIRKGTTVVNLELLGGANLQVPAFAGLAGKALAQVERTCSI